MIAERVVFDTNVLISAALLPQGPPRAALDALRAASGVLLFSDETFRSAAYPDPAAFQGIPIVRPAEFRAR